MKTSTLVILIAAVLVVGGACVGISMSGILNDNSPVVPDDPIVPPTDTPDEPDVPDEPEEPEVPMSYFATTTSSSSSKSDEPTECEHDWTNYTPDINANTHSSTCSLCQAKDTQDCTTFVEKNTDDGIIRIYSEECSTCGRSNIFLSSDNSSKTVEIYTAEGLFKFADIVNVNGESLLGYTVTLKNDIDLKNQPWTPIGQTGATEFKGVFDGKDNTISNLNVDSSAQTGGSYSSGLFGWIESHGNEGVTVKNLTVDGAMVKGHHNVGVIVGYVYGTIENCHVTNAELYCSSANDDANGDKCGGIAGFVGEDATIKDCTVSETTILAGRDAGQVVGAANIPCVIGCSAISVTVTSDGTSTGANVRNEVIGRILTDYTEDKDAKTVKIYTADGLFEFAKMVNEENNNFNGYTVTLANDIDLENKPWTPIGQTGATEFKGVFDGNGKTIFNLNITNTDTSENPATGLFGWIESHGNEGITVKNLKVDGATVKGHHNVGVIAGYLIGTIENCHVSNAAVECTHANNYACGDKAGIIAGIAAETNAVIKGCTAKDSTVKAGRDAGQIVGACIIGKVEECSAENVTVTATGDCTGNNIKSDLIGRTT